MARGKTSYEQQAKTVFIEAHSRVSFKKGEVYYTMEYLEQRAIPDNCDIEKERELLWDKCHSEVDKQVKDVLS